MYTLERKIRQELNNCSKILCKFIIHKNSQKGYSFDCFCMTIYGIFNVFFKVPIQLLRSALLALNRCCDKAQAEGIH